MKPWLALPLLLAAACDTGADTSDSDADSDTDVCERWNTARASLSEGTWTGSTSTCDPGTLSSEAHDNTLQLVNVYRFLVDLPPVTEDAGMSAQAQACALIMHANDSPNHFPPSSSACYTTEGAYGASSSAIAAVPSVMAVDLYVEDWGNDTTLGHRRWILSNSLGPIGIGGTSSYSCLQVAGGSGDANHAFTAFPSGQIPLSAMNASWVGVDSTGWSVQSDTIDLSAVTVTITRDGTDVLPVTVSQLLAGYGSNYAISILPQGWTSEVGHTYHVVLGGVSNPISYDVEPVSCD